MTNEIALTNLEDAINVVKSLLANDYVVMLSKEEELFIVNYEWAEYGDRNNIVFMSYEQYEEEQQKCCEECRKETERMRNEY